MTPEQARIGALIRFAIGITSLNVLGHLVLGFEMSVLQAVVCVLTAYFVEFTLEIVGAWSENREPRFLGGGLKKLLIFLLPAHISGMACSMLLSGGDRLLPFAFAAAIAIASKAIFTVTVDGRRRHFLNPSNTGIVATLFLFPSIGPSFPYQFTEGVYGFWNWGLPALFIASGSFLNFRFTGKMPLILAWLGGFALQAAIRHFLLGSSLVTGLLPMTGVPFLLLTFYMITDPQTSPPGVRGQIIFGLSLAAIYALFMALHIVFGIFLALTFACLGRGIILYLGERAPVRKAQVSAERLWLTLFGRPSAVTGVPATSGDMMERVTRP